jgi:hypothetical protein
MMRTSTSCRLAIVLLTGFAASCARGSLPASPSALTAGGGGRYNGTMTFQRQTGTLQVDGSVRPLDMSVIVANLTQLSGRFTAGNASGTLQGTLAGNLLSGTFQGTTLVSVAATEGTTVRTCDGRGDMTGTFNGLNVNWQITRTTYDNCAGLNVTSAGQAVSISPVPETQTAHANVVVTVEPGNTITGGAACPGSASSKGWRFTVIVAETAGVSVTLDSTFIGEQRIPGSTAVSSTTLDTPFRTLDGGSRRTYEGCSPQSGTYQAFFGGVDATGTKVRFFSPLVTLLP